MRAPFPALALAVVLSVALAACSSGASSSSASGPSTAGGLATSGAWARPAAQNGTSAAYLTIANTGTTADRLMTVSTSAAKSAQVHETMSDASGMTGMQPVSALEIPAGGTVKLEPGGYHIMLMELSGPLVVGDTIQLTLTFEKAGPMTVSAEVRQG